MSVQQYNTQAPRLGKFKGEIYRHAVPEEKLARQGRQITRTLPQNNSDTYVGRRYLPFGATAQNQNTMNQFFANGTGDRSAAMVQAHQTAEGITPPADSLAAVNITVVIQQYSCLYAYTDRTAVLYEDDIPGEMKKQCGERAALVNEQILYGALKACTNQYYGGAGVSIATVNGGLTLNLVRKIVRNLRANHTRPVSTMLDAGPKFNTASVMPGWFVYIHSDASPAVRDMPGFIDAKDYASGKPIDGEIGAVEEFRFVLHADLPSRQDAGAAVAATGLYSTSGANIDVYQFVVIGQDAFSKLALRGANAIKPTFLPTGQTSKADVFGQRGYVGVMWWMAACVENNGWMAVGNVGVPALN